MRSKLGYAIVASSAVAAFAVLSLLGSARSAAGSSIRTSSDIGAVPPSSMVTLRAATSSDVSVSPDVAIQRATAEWKLAPGQIDASIGLVRADATVDQSPMHQHQKVWLMVVNLATVSPAFPVQYRRLVVVIDGKSGGYLYAYPVEPDTVQLRNVFGAPRDASRERRGDFAASN